MENLGHTQNKPDPTSSVPSETPIERAGEQQGDQFVLGRRVSTQPALQESFEKLAQGTLAQKPTMMGKLWGTLSYLTSFVSPKGSAPKVDQVVMKGAFSKVQADPQEFEQLTHLQNQARGLGISDVKIAKATEQGTLTQIIALREKILKYYSAIVKNYDVEKTEKLALRSGSASPLTVDLLQRVIKTALKNDISLEGQVITKDGAQFLVQQDAENRLQITHQTKKILGRGAFGVVYEVLHVTTGEMMALKIAKPDSDSGISSSDANSALYREVRNLETVNGGRMHTVGVQSAARVVYSITGAGKATPGYLIPLYSKSLDKLARSPSVDIQQAITYSKQLFSGLAAVHAARIVHTDIKPDNIGVDGEEAYLADFGVAYSTEGLVGKGFMGILQWALSTALDNLTVISDQVESSWYPRQDMHLHKDKIEERNEDQAREVLEKSDVCALGRSIYYVFSGGRYYDESDSHRVLEKRGIPPELINILISTQNSDPLARPSAKEVFNAFEKIQL
ncbi:MAG: protein kinase [Chlamydiales bacterium]|nr:protein kinase [Chlamydiales bacterium]